MEAHSLNPRTTGKAQLYQSILIIFTKSQTLPDAYKSIKKGRKVFPSHRRNMTRSFIKTMTPQCPQVSSFKFIAVFCG